MSMCQFIREDLNRCMNMVEGRTVYCATHNSMMRKADRKAIKDAEKTSQLLDKQRIKNQAPKTRISKVSEKQKVKNEAYNARVKVWKVENPECKAKCSPQCNGITRDCHHKKLRGDLLMVEKYWLPVCGFCHDWIGQNSEEARNRGLTINHLEPEFVEPHKI